MVKRPLTINAVIKMCVESGNKGGYTIRLGAGPQAKNTYKEMDMMGLENDHSVTHSECIMGRYAWDLTSWSKDPIPHLLSPFSWFASQCNKQ